MKKERVFILQDDLSNEDLIRLQGTGIVAVDAEFTGLNPNRDTLCLVQLCDLDGNVIIVKRKDWANAKGLVELFQDPKTTKIFHFAIMDCSFIVKNFGVSVRNIYCTKVASKLARTYSSEHRLASMVKEIFSEDMDKTFATTDWLKDTLSPEQLHYAAQDVLWLVPLKKQLDEKLTRKGILPSGITYTELNRQCQSLIPTLVQLYINGWDFGIEYKDSVFSY